MSETDQISDESLFSFVARQAILEADGTLFAYELLFRDGEKNSFPDIEPDEATSKLLTGSHLNHGVEEITGGRIAFLNFFTETLLYRFPTSLDPRQVVIEIVETVELNKDLVRACRYIKDLGYRIALDDHDFDSRWDVLLPYADIIKVDIRQNSYEKTAAHIGKFKEAGVKLVAEKVETEEEFKRYKDLGFHYFQGFYFARPEIVKQRSIPSSKVNLMELVSESAKADFDFDRINRIIERDVSLSYMLLRFVNNPIYYRANEITSLSHALRFMGEVEVKKFIALLALAKMNDSKPQELVQLCLVRAKFCEMLSAYRKDQNNPPKGFLVGLFSALDALLDQRMEDVVEKLPIDDELKRALCGDAGRLKDYLSAAKAFELGDWPSLQKHANHLALDNRMLHLCYHKAVKWANAMSSVKAA